MLNVKIAIALLILALMVLPAMFIVRSRLDRARRGSADEPDRG
jgi:hypothetical protein